MKSTYLADKFLAKVLTGEDFTVTNVYVGLMVNGVEVSGGNYAREQLDKTKWATPVNYAGGGRVRNYTEQVAFAEATAPWGDIDQFFLADAASGGNVLYASNIKDLEGNDTVIPIGTGGTFIFKPNQLSVVER